VDPWAITNYGFAGHTVVRYCPTIMGQHRGPVRHPHRESEQSVRLRSVSGSVASPGLISSSYIHSFILEFVISADLGQLNTNSATWTVALPAGWEVMISIQDGSQDDVWSAPVRLTSHGRRLAHPPPTLPTNVL
jgi:hypothetical protein